jgi:hypothetical protein
VTSIDAYTSFLQLANKLNSNDDVNIDTGRFCLLYNKHSRIWLDQKTGKGRSTKDIDEVQGLVKQNVLLVPIGDVAGMYIDFKLPNDWFDHIGGYALCNKGSCENRLLNMDQVKNDFKRLVLFDENWRPDFDFEWFPITVGANGLQAYYRDFTITEARVDYYRYPVDIDIAGYIHPDGTPSITVNPDLDAIYVNEIIDLVVADVSRIYQNQEKMQLDINRIQTTQ